MTPGLAKHLNSTPNPGSPAFDVHEPTRLIMPMGVTVAHVVRQQSRLSPPPVSLIEYSSLPAQARIGLFYQLHYICDSRSKSILPEERSTNERQRGPHCATYNMVLITQHGVGIA